MKIEPHVTSLEVSKKLKELGVKQENLFCWFTVTNGTHQLDYNTYKQGELFSNEYVSAFTASELLGLIPLSINDWVFRIESYNGVYEVKYCDFSGEKQLWVSSHTNIVNALATMLIALINKKLIDNL